MIVHNADGSIAEMCGNGLRVFLRYLDEEGLVTGTEVQLTINSDLELLNVQMPRNIYQDQCLHTVYDAGCGLVAGYGKAGPGNFRPGFGWYFGGDAAIVELKTAGSFGFDGGEEFFKKRFSHGYAEAGVAPIIRTVSARTSEGIADAFTM